MKVSYCMDWDKLLNIKPNQSKEEAFSLSWDQTQYNLILIMEISLY